MTGRLPAANADLGLARREFFERGGLPVGRVTETILQSWRRCQRLGLASESLPAIEPVPQAQLREMRERHETLWRLARAELDALAGDAASSGSIVVLTDEDGWILDAEGHPQFLDKAGRVALMPGTCWNESRIGTNAIGTAIVERRSVEVRGGEHYLAPHRVLNCSSVPVHDPYGRVVGVLDISGDATVPPVHALGLARHAVAAIEHRYFDAGLSGCELLRLHRDPGLLGSAREGLLAFRQGRLVAANEAGLRLFGLARSELGRIQFGALFDDTLVRLRDDGVLLDRHGLALYGRVQDGTTPAPRVARALPRPAPALPRGDVVLFDAVQEHELTRACRVLDAGLPVLVLGETGSGKEVFARELHRRSARAARPFVAVNCAALPEGLIEAELFGYEDGAFTGARRQGNAGLLRQADGGVLFLDEIGDMPPALQPRLLRVLQERELSPLGGGKPVKLDFALICATHRELDAAVAEGRFRADLYYRINHYPARLAPLREQADRAGLIQALWARQAGTRRLSAAALSALTDYDWPGNRRQLAACLRLLVALSDEGETVDTAALPAYLRSARAAAPGPASAPGTTVANAVAPDTTGLPAETDAALDAITETAMRAALDRCDGNVSRAAKQLGISRSTLYRRLGAPARG
ncbi:MAG: sigma-54-dependent Fis family transcriptional regulator [Lysobacterales bacterium 69-70]|nr:sigma-54-dependent Fis family transcriptional regulator [Xanthomonadaceae bacterium]ODU30700.1 MAG: sigma-54-dependent Fis family transcriptional regulator [Xanthomonadaceae bacterium SCN 69-320]ODV16107.1 MAG: sigma-54-dependent Fis family transcriptional regulator [Xanthomonadaceae bacterium SCN 69-25]OJZ00239.1 MAG: sigma-54-dependent Fis family transcriptional regulator [Xanthomonadales bacterium 69-70]